MMNKLNVDIFTEGMALLSEIYDKEISKMFISAYYETLQDLTEDEFHKAILHVRKHKTFNKFPLESELLNAARGSEEDQTQLAWNSLFVNFNIRSKYIIFKDRVIHDCIRTLGGWDKVKYPDSENMHWMQESFKKQYILLSKHPSTEIPDKTRTDAHRYEQINFYVGFNENEIKEIEAKESLKQIEFQKSDSNKITEREVNNLVDNMFKSPKWRVSYDKRGI